MPFIQLLTLLFCSCLCLAQPETSDPGPTQAQLDEAWGRFHPATQQYLEEVAQFYSIDDSERLWYLKIYLEDERNLPRMSKSARDARLGARKDEQAPAWYCLDTRRQLNASSDELIIAWIEFNQSLTSQRTKALTSAGLDPFIFFIVIEEVNHHDYRGVLINENAKKIEAVLYDPPSTKILKPGDVVVLSYGLKRRGSTSISYWNGDRLFSFDLPAFEPVNVPDLEGQNQFTDFDRWSAPAISPHRLAYEAVKRRLIELPEWRSRRSKNPEYTEWLANLNKQSTLSRQTHGVVAAPEEYLYEWSLRPKSLRFVD